MAWLLAAAVLAAGASVGVEAATSKPATAKSKSATAKSKKAKDAQSKKVPRESAQRTYDAYEKEATVYWQSVVDKRRQRNAKRAANEPITIDDYVLTQPPLYTGPPAKRPPVPSTPGVPRIPVVADVLKAAADKHGFVPQRPESDLAFKHAYARVALAAGLTAQQAVRIYAFETGGNGTYDVQAGLTHPSPKARAISPAVGYNQLLITNSIGLMAEHGDRFVEALRQKAETLSGDARQAMDKKIAATRKMIAFTRTVRNAWVEHDKLAKTTLAGVGIHAAVLDADLGPLLQTQKLMDSVEFAKRKGYMAPLTGAELEMMNFTGDGNGFDLVTMPADMRPLVPTSNFFQRGGYERNPIARRTAVVSALFASIDAKMDRSSQLPGAVELAEAFTAAAGERATASGDAPSSTR